VSEKNASYNLLGGYGLLGTVRANIRGLELLLEPGPRAAPSPTWDTKRRKEYEQWRKEYEHRRDAPLRGVERGQPESR
jgi:hypothetical protein